MTRRAWFSFLALALACAGRPAAAQQQQQQPQPQLEANYDESRVGAYTLPDPLSGASGALRGTAGWAARRAEIVDLFAEHVYGRSPRAPERLRFERIEENPRAMGGRATLRRVAVISGQGDREHRFELTLFLPNAARRPAPVFLLLNSRLPSNTDPTRAQKSAFWPAEEMVARGYGIAALQVGELAPDDTARFREGVIGLFEGETAGPRRDDAWGALAAWAWGASRAMDYLVTDDRVDAARVAVVGHSRSGKAALWAGAQDERFAMVVSNESGEGGAALARRNYGETIEPITALFPHWFTADYSRYAGREAELPVDQHLLLAAIAPRALYVASAVDDRWSDPRGEFLSLVHASPAYALWGEPWMGAGEMPPLDRPLVVGRRGYHVRTGAHDLTVYDWQRFADFADRVWGRAGTVTLTPSLRPGSLATEWTPDGNGTWEIRDGTLVLAKAGTPAGPVRRPAALLLLRGEPLARASIRAEVRSTAPTTVIRRDVQVVFGYRDPTHFYYVHLSGATDDVHNGIFLVDGADRRRIDDGTAAPVLTDNEWHRVRVERDGTGGWIEVYVDRSPIPALRARDTTLRSGRVGVGSFDDTGEFRSITVTGSRP